MESGKIASWSKSVHQGIMDGGKHSEDYFNESQSESRDVMYNKTRPDNRNRPPSCRSPY